MEKDIKLLQEQTDGSFLEVNVPAVADSVLSLSSDSLPETVLKTAFATAAQGSLADTAVQGTPWTSEGYLAWSVVTDCYAPTKGLTMGPSPIKFFDTELKSTDGTTLTWGGASIVTGTPWTSEGYVSGTPWTSEGYLGPIPAYTDTESGTPFTLASSGFPYTYISWTGSDMTVRGDGVLNLTGGSLLNVTAHDGIVVNNSFFTDSPFASPTPGTAAMNIPNRYLLGSWTDGSGNSILTSATGVTGTPWTGEGYLTSISGQDLSTANNTTSAFITAAAIPSNISAFTNDAAYITSASIPTNVSSFTNDAGYLSSGSAFATSAQGSSADTAYGWGNHASAGYYVGDGSAFATAAQGALANTAVQGTPWTSAGYLTDISSLTAGAVSSLSGHNVSELTNNAGFITSASIPTNVSSLTNDAGYLTSAWSPSGTVAYQGDNVSEFTNDVGYITTETDPVVGAITGIIKSNGSGTISAATAGTDYAHAPASAAVADGTYTVGIGSATNGTVTTSNGIITAIVEATDSGGSAPSTPTGLSTNPISSTEVDLTWDAMSGATGYKVYRDASLVGSPSTNSFNDTGLAASTTYTYTVKSHNSYGDSTACSGVTGTTSGGGGGGGGAYAMEFDGASNYITIPHSADFYPSGDFTIEFWAKTSSGGYLGLNLGGGGGTSGYILLLGVPYQFYIGINSGGFMGSPAGTVNDGSWHHFAVQREGSDITLWFDGTVCFTGTLGGAINDPGNDFQIGAYNANYYAGVVDEFRFSNLARYPGTTPFVPATSFTPDGNTVMYLKFDEGTGTTVADSSGNGHNATATGTPAWVTGV